MTDILIDRKDCSVCTSHNSAVMKEHSVLKGSKTHRCRNNKSSKGKWSVHNSQHVCDPRVQQCQKGRGKDLTTELALLPPNKVLRSTRNSSTGTAKAAAASRVFSARVETNPPRLGFNADRPGRSRACSRALETKLPALGDSSPRSAVTSGTSSS